MQDKDTDTKKNKKNIRHKQNISNKGGQQLTFLAFSAKYLAFLNHLLTCKLQFKYEKVDSKKDKRFFLTIKGCKIIPQ